MGLLADWRGRRRARRALRDPERALYLARAKAASDLFEQVHTRHDLPAGTGRRGLSALTPPTPPVTVAGLDADPRAGRDPDAASPADGMPPMSLRQLAWGMPTNPNTAPAPRAGTTQGGCQARTRDGSPCANTALPGMRSCGLEAHIRQVG